MFGVCKKKPLLLRAVTIPVVETTMPANGVARPLP